MKREKINDILLKKALFLYDQHGYKYVKNIFSELEKLHGEISSAKDKGQSWRVTKGHIFEQLIIYVINEEVENMGLKIVTDSVLKGIKLNVELAEIKRKLLIDYGKFGCHLPDADIVIYEPSACKIIAILSIKVSLRERIAQSGYWKLKLYSQKITRHVKVYFVTQDKDGNFNPSTSAKSSNSMLANKSKSIAVSELDGSYVLSTIEDFGNSKIRPFNQLIADLKKLSLKS